MFGFLKDALPENIYSAINKRGDKMGYLWKQGFFDGANPYFSIRGRISQGTIGRGYYQE
jgi:hypothetical protein